MTHQPPPAVVSPDSSDTSRSASAGLISAPRIKPPPERHRRTTSLLRLAPYVKPYRARWISMLLFSLGSLVATIVIPLMTKAVIDGPVRHHDQHGLWVLGTIALGVGMAEAILWFGRRWLVARATMGVER